MLSTMTRRRLLLGTLGLSAYLAPVSRGAAGEAYPVRSIRLLVGGAAGSAPDTIARLIGERLATALRQPVVVDDRPGASGIIAMQSLISNPPDGYTIALATMSQAVFNTYLFSTLSYDPLRDLEPISPLVAGGMVIVANPRFPANTFGEFIAAAKARPGEVLFGTTQLGSPPDVVVRFLMRAAGVNVTFVPFKSGPEGVNAVLRGDVQMFVDGALIVAAQVKAGGLKALAVTGSAREKELPDVPTVAESGFPAILAEPWIGLVAPARTPPEIVERLNREITGILQDEDLRRRLQALGFVPVTKTPAQFRALIRDDHARWGTVIKEAGLKLD
jgi:tripartite-type tricarboxylate transporter receptor subunit TctC